jgi:hypothetical protein
VDTGNDPGRDEYGLPPVDIEIPDDARDLDRDVQAYYRELRARRRHVRFRRLTGPLTRHGMVMPLVAACLAGTLLVGTLLTVLAGRQIPLLHERGPFGTALAGAAARGTRPQSTAPQTAPPQTAPPAVIPHGLGRPLPDIRVTLDGRQVALRSLAPAVLAWIPPSCDCAGVVRQLVKQATVAGIPLYLVGDAGAVTELPALAGQAGLGRHVAIDLSNVLGTLYNAAGLTAILVNGSYSVGSRDVVRHLNVTSAQPAAKRLFADRLRVLASGSPGTPAGPAANGVPPAS